jgi:competence protein ComEA
MLVLAMASTAFAEDTGKDQRINVNTAPSSELVVLPGIGPKKAEAIVLYREANGPFATVDDLIQVKGIGPKTMEKLRPLITVGKQPKKQALPKKRAGKS